MSDVLTEENLVAQFRHLDSDRRHALAKLARDLAMEQRTETENASVTHTEQS